MLKQKQIQTCPICQASFPSSLGDHVRDAHDEQVLKELIFSDKQNGIPDIKIGARYRISFNYLQKVITEKIGTNISSIKPKKIKSWEPSNFSLEPSTVWSFRSRGNWATHDGRYRGNWSPYIPRNVMLKYSKPGDMVLDQFIGSGTTAVEAKLLGRRCIARDINPFAVELAGANSDFIFPSQLGQINKHFEADFKVGDARKLTGIKDQTIDLICTHPPYAGIVNYSDDIPEDLSKFSVPEFLKNMRTVADECFRVLKPGSKCVILIGDGRKEKKVVPIGFQTIRQFLNAGFILKDLVIKRQHNCRTTGFWYKSSIKYNFLLLAHEYLPIFEKPKRSPTIPKSRSNLGVLPWNTHCLQQEESQQGDFETKTVWLDGGTDTLVRRNIVHRYGDESLDFNEIQFGEKPELTLEINNGLNFLRFPDNINFRSKRIRQYVNSVTELAAQFSERSELDSYIVIEVQDIRYRKQLIPFGLSIFEELFNQNNLTLKEIILVAPTGTNSPDSQDELNIVHKYLFVFVKE